MLSLMLRSFIWAAWWPASTWLIAMEKATARASGPLREDRPRETATRSEDAEAASAETTQVPDPSSAGDTTPSNHRNDDQISAASDTRKDDMVNDSFKKMEMPGSVRDLMKMGIEQARYAFENFASTSEQAMRSFEASAGPMGDSMRSLNEKISQITRANAEANFALAMKLAETNDFQQALSIQTDHVKRQMDIFGKQIEEIREMAAKAIKEAQANAASGFDTNKGTTPGNSDPVGGPGTFVPGGEGRNTY